MNHGPFEWSYSFDNGMSAQVDQVLPIDRFYPRHNRRFLLTSKSFHIACVQYVDCDTPQEAYESAQKIWKKMLEREASL